MNYFHQIDESLLRHCFDTNIRTSHLPSNNKFLVWNSVPYIRGKFYRIHPILPIYLGELSLFSRYIHSCIREMITS